MSLEDIWLILKYGAGGLICIIMAALAYYIMARLGSLAYLMSRAQMKARSRQHPRRETNGT